MKKWFLLVVSVLLLACLNVFSKDLPSKIQKLQADFLSHGIEVTVSPPKDNAIAIEEFNALLPDFIEMLLLNKKEVIRRKKFIKNFDITFFSQMDTWNEFLSLAVGMNSSNLKNYFRLQDKRILFEKRTGLNFDLGLETGMYGDLQFLNQMIKYMIQHESDLNYLKPMFIRVLVEDVLSYQYPVRYLIVNKAQFVENFNFVIGQLKPASEFLKFADENEIPLFGNLLIEKDRMRFAKNYSVLNSLKLQIADLKRTRWVSQIEFTDGFSDVRITEDGSLVIPQIEKTISSESSIQALHQHWLIASTLRMTIDTKIFNELNSTYVRGMDILTKNIVLLTRKSSHISKIQFSKSSSFRFGILRIGLEDSADVIEKIIEKIPQE